MKRIIVTLVLCAGILPLMAGGNAQLEIADDLYYRLQFNKAAEHYKSYLKNKEDDVYAWQQLVTCYDMTNDYDNLSASLKKLVTLLETMKENEVYAERSQAYLAYAEVLQIKGEYDAAAEYYKKFLTLQPGDQRAKNQLAACEQDPGLIGNAGLTRFAIENMPFNSDAFEYSPNFWNNTLLYTSTASDDNESNQSFGWTGGAYSDLRQYQRDSTKEVFLFFNDMDELNTKYNDGPFAVDPVTDKFYYTRNSFNETKTFKKKGVSKYHFVNLKIYVAENNLGKIGAVREFKYNSKNFNTGHPAISPDGEYLVFVSDSTEKKFFRDQGEELLPTDRNLYYCSRDSNGWKMPRLLSSDINTEGDELFPYFHKDGSLYFASDGLGSRGGLDIYRAEVDFARNKVTALEHLGDDINSTYDDFGIVFKSKKEGYFTSDRPSGKGKDDIYSFRDMTVLLRGTVVHADTREPLPNSEFSVEGHGMTIASGTTDDKGRFQALVYRDQLYNVMGDQDYYIENTLELSTAKLKGEKPIEIIVPLNPVRYTLKLIDAESGACNRAISGSIARVELQCNQPSKDLVIGRDCTSKLPVHKDCSYFFAAKAEGYLAKELLWRSPTEDSHEEIVLALDKVTFTPIALRNIYYDFNKSNLRLAESTPDLEKLLKFLNDNPELTIQINSHTDARASKSYNISLSQRRAQSVVNWLTARGIPTDRIVAIGYGETSPVNECVDGVQCTEEQHQRNRRTEFQVIDLDGSTKIASDKREDIEVDPCKDCPF